MFAEERSVDVVVAAWGPAFGYPTMPVFAGEQFADQGPEVPYEGRAKVTVHALSTATLGEVIDEAAERFGVSWPHDGTLAERVHWVAFFREGDERRMASEARDWLATLRTVDEGGEPSWTVRWSEIRLDELLATSAAGLLAGDPLRPYFWPVIPQGDLATLAQSLWSTWTYWEHALSAYGTVEIARALLRRIQRGKAAATGEREAWDDALRRPQDFVPWLDDVPRSTAEVARKTGLSPERAEGLLLGMGYTADADGRWRSGGDPPAVVLRRELLQIKCRGCAPDVSEIAERVKAVAEGDGEACDS